MIETILAAEGGAPEGAAVFFPAGYDILWSLVVFVVIAAFFGIFAIPKFRKILDERAERIEGGIAHAEAAQAEAAKALDEYKKQLADARAEAARIREAARAEGAEILADLKQQATGRGRSRHRERPRPDRGRACRLPSRRSVPRWACWPSTSRRASSASRLTDDAKASAVVDRFLADLEADQNTKAGR